MDYLRTIDLLEKNIVTERSAVRTQTILAGGVVCAGLIAAGLVHFASGPTLAENYKWMLTIAGTLISSAAGFPLKDIYNKRNKIIALTYLRDEFETLQGGGVTIEQTQAEELIKRFWNIFEKNF